MKNLKEMKNFSFLLNYVVTFDILSSNRSSRLQMFFKTDVLKISQHCQENTCVGVSI